MTPDRYASIKQIFLEVCELDPEDRERRLSETCGDDAELREQVGRLLAQHAFLAANPPVAGMSTAVEPGAQPMNEARPEFPDFQPGQLVAGRYRIGAKLGEGGLGRVFSAEDTRLKIGVALKFLPRFHAFDPLLRARVEAEVKLARSISHPNICRIHDIGETDEWTFISMEHVQGEDLKSLLHRVGRLAGDRAIEMARQICIGLAAAHNRGVVHRDLKPANIMLDNDGHIVITDFGLALLIKDIGDAEMLAGTPRYMAPEQLGAGMASEKSDLYALGLVLYEMFTGQPAFEASGLLEYLRLHRSADPVPPSNIVPEMNLDVEAVILRCLRKDPAERPESAIQVATWLPGGDPLAAALAAGGIPTREMVAEAASTSSFRPRAMYGVAAGFLAMLVAAVGLGINTHPVSGGAGAKAPEVLIEEARRNLALGGLKTKPADAVGKFVSARDLVSLPAVDARDETRLSLAVGSGHSLLFAYQAWYVEPVAAGPPLLPQLTMQQPPSFFDATPQSALVILDATGPLLLMESSLLPEAAAGPAGETVDWLSMVKGAGFTPDDPADAAAKVGAAIGGGFRSNFPAHSTSDRQRRARIEIAINAGHVEYFAVLREDSAPATAGHAGIERRIPVSTVRNIVFVALFCVAVPVAWRYSRKRGDLEGALRLGGFVSLVRLTAKLLSIHHLGAFSFEVESFASSLIISSAEGLIIAIFYLALETNIRRLWPRTLGSWSRILAARFDDPYVGRDVLRGCLVGAFWAVILFLDRRIPDWFGWNARDHLRLGESLDALLGPRFALAAACDLLLDGIYRGLILLMMLVAATWATGCRRALAGIVVFLIAALMYAPAAGHPVTAATLFAFGLVGVAILVLIRWGLVSLLASVFTAGLLGFFPLGLDPARWFTGYGVFAILLTLGLGVWSLRTSLRPARPNLIRPLP